MHKLTWLDIPQEVRRLTLQLAEDQGPDDAGLSIVHIKVNGRSARLVFDFATNEAQLLA